eukprot:scaffold444323_cov43-Prasinocladus_malaysianus.AAC.1
MTNLTIEHVRTTSELTEEQRQKKLTKFAKKQPLWEKRRIFAYLWLSNCGILQLQVSYFVAIIMKRYAVEGK